MRRLTGCYRARQNPQPPSGILRRCRHQTLSPPGLRLRRRCRTTIEDPAAAKAADLIGRDFTAQAVNQRYVGDITYLPVGERGFVTTSWPSWPAP
jgi:transposase InsO family protein